MAKTEENKRVAPYVSFKALNYFLERIKNVSVPNKVDSDLLLDYGVTKGNVFALISALKFLGLIDDQGTPTDWLKSLQVTGEEYTDTLQKIIKNSYNDLFSKLDISKDTREHIRNYFSRNFSAAKASDSTNLFLYLCRQAQIPLSEELRSGRNTPATKSQQKSRDVTRQMNDRIIIQEKSVLSNQEDLKNTDVKTLYLKKLIEQVAPPDTTGKDAEAIRAEAELRKSELDRIERLLNLLGNDG